jgi:cytochrome oxidase Cu insertion factor (SCO1/SenC/PrrC family)
MYSPLKNWKPGLATMSVLAVLLLTLSGCDAAGQLISGPTLTPPPPGGTPVDPPIPLPDFSLIDQHGSEVTAETLMGKPAILYFGYTFCPDVCPLTLAELSQVATALEEDAQRVNFVFISVDFQRDTPERLSQYLPAFNADFIGLTTTDEANLQALTQPLGIFYELDPDAGSQAEYLVAHTAATFMLDSQGQVRERFAYRTPPEIIAQALQDELAAMPEGSAAG